MAKCKNKEIILEAMFVEFGKNFYDSSSFIILITDLNTALSFRSIIHVYFDKNPAFRPYSNQSLQASIPWPVIMILHLTPGSISFHPGAIVCILTSGASTL